MIYGEKGKIFCQKHGYVTDGDSLFDAICLVCKEIAEKDLCRECEIHKADITFSDSTMAWVHGMSERLCRCCYFKRVEKAKEDTEQNYLRLKEELRSNPCVEVVNPTRKV